MTIITKKRFEQLVSDFEYGIIDRCRIASYTISWQPADQTCFMFEKGQVVTTGGFEYLLEKFFYDEELETA
jgi:hypothetical protein